MYIILITQSKTVAQNYTDILRLKLKSLGYSGIASNVEWVKNSNNYYAVQLSEAAMKVFDLTRNVRLENTFNYGLTH